ncbi:hypothetical protein VCRA2128O98_30018 [Vibrio crassostreae]|nr:hypothetical protein VCRA2119O145_260072 [Vibrio crassostreae]CAK1959225.1 hypothetical protein VCRA2118O144_280071 [Vibrio crassostreae]CAK2597478.1 hypothetical protein VCRA2121O153_110136 [Vibrio crassostreae]CAK2688768.1 hypothetical protein VCRA2120O150_120135 [Vibrio crassostreae]CAK2813300.1 hypothetical protein VCRA2120O151_270027 [Vibrio crassostreae]
MSCIWWVEKWTLLVPHILGNALGRMSEGVAVEPHGSSRLH